MGTIGYGYGSEWHLLRYLGYHRSFLTEKILKLTGGIQITWLDFNFAPKPVTLRLDREFTGVSFINDAVVQQKWQSFWPQSGNAQNWDAIGKIHYQDHEEWLLVEAKAHVNELRAPCGAKDPESKRMLKEALMNTASAFGVKSHQNANWMKDYYQFANRLAVLYFLEIFCSPTQKSRLVFIYFYGDTNLNAVCPNDEKGWSQYLERIYCDLGINLDSTLYRKVSNLFIPVSPYIKSE